MVRLNRMGLAVVCLSLLAGCSSVPSLRMPPEERPPVAVPDAAAALPMPAAAESEPAVRTLNAAVTALLAQAESRRRQGDWVTASAQLERALRIAPAEPAVYEALVQLRLEQGRAREAEQLALRAANLPGLTGAEQSRLWQQVAVCRIRLGDAEGAAQARQRAGTY